MKRIFVLCLFIFSLSLLLSGCSMNANDLLSVPKLPTQYLEVQKQISLLLTSNVELTSPLSGTNRASVQLTDLDGDGVEEALAFCTVTSGENVGLRFYVFRLEHGKYVQAACMDGEGDSFDVVEYLPVNSQKQKLLVVGWRLGANPVMGLTIYQYDNNALKLINREEYTGLLIDDLNGDQQDNLLVLRHNTTGDDIGKAVLYTFSGTTMRRLGEAPLSMGVSKAEEIYYDQVGNNLYGVVIDQKLDIPTDEDTNSVGEKPDYGMLTDVLLFADDTLTNVSFDETIGRSEATFRPVSYPAADVDGDGVTEFPHVSFLPQQGGNPSNSYLRMDWCSVSSFSGSAEKRWVLEKEFTAFTQKNASWIFVVPEEMVPNLTLLNGYQNEDMTSVQFCSYDADTKKIGSPLWEIFLLTGINRYDRAADMNLSELARTSVTLYGVKQYNSSTDNSLSYDEITRCFMLQS